MSDCNRCLWATRNGSCASWDCRFVDQREAYEAYNREKADANKWISVSERLPDIKEHHVSEPCIVYCENGAYGFAELEENIFGQVGWNCERDDEYHEPLGKVLAWMPLPKPYQEDKDGK